MLLKRIALTASTLAFLLVPGAASAQDFRVQVTSEFTETPLSFTGGVADPYIVLWNVMAHQGQLALCGTGFLRDPRFAATIRSMARNGGLQVDGVTRPVNLTFFNRARSVRDLRSGTATCRVVGQLPSGSSRISLSFDSGTLRN